MIPLHLLDPALRLVEPGLQPAQYPESASEFLLQFLELALYRIEPAPWRSSTRGETIGGLLLAPEAQDDGTEQHGDSPLLPEKPKPGHT